MRKSIARKFAGLLAAIVLTSTFASDYNSIGARASEVTEITDGTLEAEGVNEGSDEESAPANLEAEGSAVEENETAVEDETPVEEETPVVEETPVAEEESTEGVSDETNDGVTDEATDASNEDSAEETADAAGEGSTEAPADDAVVEKTADAASTASTEATTEAPVEEVREKEFNESKEINGILVSLYADPEVLPDDAVLDIKEVEAGLEEQIKVKVEEDIENTTNTDVEVKTASYDINIYSQSLDGYVLPESGTVEVKFSQVTEDDENTKLSVYHVENDSLNVTKVAEAANETPKEVTFSTNELSIYTVSLYSINAEDVVETEAVEDEEETDLSFLADIVRNAQLDSEGVEADYKIYAYRGVNGKYSKNPWFVVDSNSTEKIGDKTVVEKYGKAIVGQPFEPEFSEKLTLNGLDYVLDTKAEGSKLKLDEVSPDSEKNVLYLYFNTESSYVDVAYYVLLPQYSVPASSVNQDWGKYYPEKNNPNYSYEKWQGTAYDLYELDKLDIYSKLQGNIDSRHNLWDPYVSGLIDMVINTIPKDTINSDFKNDSLLTGITIKDDKGSTRSAEWSDIKWFVYKNVAGDTSGSADPVKSYHIDGYVKNADISVTYHANYGGKVDPVEPTVVNNVRTGHDYTVLSYDDAFETTNENYEFIGWAAVPNPGEEDRIYSEKETVFLIASAEFYAQWKPKEFKTEYFDEDGVTLISSNETAKPEAVRQAYGDSTYNIDDPDSKTDSNGYVREFIGWRDENGNLLQRSDIAKTTVEGDQKFIAEYKSVSRNKNYYVNYYFQKADGTYDDGIFEPAKLSYKDGAYVSDYMDSYDKAINVPVGEDGAPVEVKPEKAVTRKIGTENIDYTLVNGQVNQWKDIVKADESRVVVLKVYYKRADFDAALTVRAISESSPYNGKKQNSTTADYVTGSELEKTYDITVVANVDNNGITHVDESKAGNKKVTTVTLKNKTTGETFVLDATKLNEKGFIIDSRFDKIQVVQGTFSITPIDVNLQSWTLKKEFDGSALTNEQRADYAIGISVEEVKEAPELKTNSGWVEGEGATFKFTGTQTVKGTSKNLYTYELKDNTKACDYNITKQEGDLIVESRSEKYEIIIKLATEKEEDGLDTYVYYQGVDMKANMAVDVTVNTEVIKNAMKNAGLISSLKEGLGNVLDSALGSMTINASAEENAEIVNIDPVVKEVTDKLSVTVSGMYLTGGHGTKVGVYPIYLHTKDLNISMTLDGKTQNITDQFKLTVIKHETGVKVESPLDLEADNEKADTLEADPTEVIGNLHVLKREVVLTSGSASKVYDGTPLTEKTITASELGEKTGFVHGEGANFNVTGTITDPGSVANTFTYALYDGSVEGQPATDIGNYDITTVEGTLTVTKDTEVPDKDDKKKKKDKDPDDDEKIPNDNVDDDPDEGGSTNQGSVLGEKRPAETPATEEPAVLGARRGGTEDNTNSARVLVLVFAAGAAVSLMAVGKRKKEENE
ncbi:hypothetical protein [Butyrivibrio sp. WCD3002]|uniref:hypothetical protein n=1 Tax=Butyrivibrio sp. WCD3002 TaxID=1280676 RepID=UPI0004148042|nr:hypothetical protein [Butyrivibrio sp. WCD3002]